MSILTVFLSALFFTLLGGLYVKGYNFVKAHKPEKLVTFYFITATVRFVFVSTIIAIYAVMSQNRDDANLFAAMFFGMYAVMMVITLTLKH